MNTGQCQNYRTERSDKNYRTTKKVRSKFRHVFLFLPSEENRIIEQQGTGNNRTFVLLNFRSIILAPTIYKLIDCSATYWLLVVFGCFWPEKRLVSPANKLGPTQGLSNNLTLLWPVAALFTLPRFMMTIFWGILGVRDGGWRFVILYPQPFKRKVLDSTVQPSKTWIWPSKDEGFLGFQPMSNWLHPTWLTRTPGSVWMPFLEGKSTTPCCRVFKDVHLVSEYSW